MNEPVEVAVLAAERRRCAAMLDNDAAKLGLLLDDRLMFNHSSGATDDRAAYLGKIASGRIRYGAIDWADARVIVLEPGAALMTGRMTTIVKVEGSDRRLENRALAIWSRTDGAWRLVAFQSTPLQV